MSEQCDNEKPVKVSEHSLRARVKTLTPQEKAERLAKLAVRAIDELENQLGAEKRYWNEKKQEWEIVPDFAVRQRAIETILNYDIGRPVERRIEVQVKAETAAEKMELVKKSPEALRILLAAGMISHEEYGEALDSLQNDRKGKSERTVSSVAGEEK